jgi:hypothetical protein
MDVKVDTQQYNKGTRETSFVAAAKLGRGDRPNLFDETYMRFASILRSLFFSSLSLPFLETSNICLGHLPTGYSD